MKLFKNIVALAFSISGPFVISFGTFSGLLFIFEKVFGFKNIETNRFLCATIYIIYLIFLWVAAFINSYSNYKLGLASEQDSSDLGRVTPGQFIVQKLNRQQPIAIFFNGGITKVIDYVLEKNGITFIDVLEKPEHWKTFSPTLKEFPIFRLLKDGKSLEITFPKTKSNCISIREADPNTGAYGTANEEKLSDWFVLAFITPMSYIKQRYFG